jgi:hypothetical protein
VRERQIGASGTRDSRTRVGGWRTGFRWAEIRVPTAIGPDSSGVPQFGFILPGAVFAGGELIVSAKSPVPFPVSRARGIFGTRGRAFLRFSLVLVPVLHSISWVGRGW